MKRAALATLCALLAALAMPCAAQTYPSKPVKMVVGFPPGGGTDILARIVAQRLSDAWGQQVIVENRPGASATIAANVVAHAPPDGYTISMGQLTPNAIAPALYPQLPYDAMKDFVPIVLVGTSPNVLVVTPALPVRTVSELVAYAKAQGAKPMTYASSGSGSLQHIAAELFKSQAGVNFTHVPYKGSGQALTDLMGGQVELHFDQITSAASHIQGGKLRALMVTSRNRNATLPDVPTAAEAGYAAFEATNVTGLIAPAGTPRDVVDKINAATQKVLAQPAIREKFAGIGAVTTGGKPEDFAAYIAEDFAKWTRIVREAHVKVE